jgi:hypothetical protein
MHPIRRFGDDSAVAARADALKHVLQLYCTYERRKIAAWRPRSVHARDFVNKARLALFPKRKQKYQNGNIHRKLRVPTSTILLLSKVQYGSMYSTSSIQLSTTQLYTARAKD